MDTVRLHRNAAHLETLMTHIHDGVDLAPVDMRHTAFRHDPHPLLRDLRESTRVARDVLGIWLVLRHADVSAMLRSSRLSREVWRSPGYDQVRPFLADSTLERTTHPWMLLNDPPKHTRLRRLVGGAFRPGVVEAPRERITAVTDELLDDLEREAAAGGSFDLMPGLAQRLPVRIVCDVPGLMVAASEAGEGGVPGAPAMRGETPLGDDELRGNLILMLIAGHETTTNLIGNGVLTLLRHPGELARLRASPGRDPARMRSAIEEMLRYEGSVTTIPRHTVEPYVIGDVVVPP
jgi:pikromycin synthase